MNRIKVLVLLLVTWVIFSGCSGIQIGDQRVKGSGHIIHETRSAAGFTTIVLESSANIRITRGSPESVVVRADDNIVPLIQTNVEDSRLVIDTKPDLTYLATKPVQVEITVTSLEAVINLGFGNIEVSGITGDAFEADQKGPGEIILTGAVNSVNFSLSGPGNIQGDQLKAKHVTAVNNGSGTIAIYASDSLEATVNGPGRISYSGNPAEIYKSVTGDGSITEQFPLK